jgi:lipopolysaccharide/colanic/teichoic acid biosynthesis glycosyltransferase
MIKRAFDILMSGLLILVLSPLLILVIVILAFTGEREIFYAQKRIGRYGQPFQILKFATMLKNSSVLPGGDITGANDPRVLPFGRILRKTKINELPQLFNVLIGDMSVIGYRPLTPRVASLFPQEYWEALSDERPGLSGIGSIVFRDEERLLAFGNGSEKTYSDLIVPHKMALELWYRQHQSFGTDFALLLLTVLVVTFPQMSAENWFSDLPAPPRHLLALRAAAPSR